MQVFVVYVDSNKKNVKAIFTTEVEAATYQAALGQPSDVQPAVLHTYTAIDLTVVTLD